MPPGASVAGGLLGEGRMWNPEKEKYEPAADVLKRFQLKPAVLLPKEGLALINGTQFIAAIRAGSYR